MSRRARITHRLVLAVLCLLCGVAINFGVAWWCVRRHDVQRRMSETDNPGGSEVFLILPTGQVADFEDSPGRTRWSIAVPEGWPAAPCSTSVRESAGRATTFEVCVLNSETSPSSKCIVCTQTAGWPARCWTSVNWSGPASAAGRGVGATHGEFGLLTIPPRWAGVLGVDELPIGVRPRAFLANTLLYALPLATLLAGMGALRYWRRRSARCCPSCGYDRSGIPESAICPECGTSP